MAIVSKCPNFQWDSPYVTVLPGWDLLLAAESPTSCCYYQKPPLGHPAGLCEAAQRDQGPLEICWQTGTQGVGSVRTQQGSTLVLAISVARLCCQDAIPPRTGVPSQLPAPSLGSCTPSCSQQLQLCLLWEFWKHRASLQPWLLLLTPPGRFSLGILLLPFLELCARCWGAQECPSRSFALSFLSLALVKAFQSLSDGSQMCCRCLCLMGRCPASCTP